jgi:hypothetical protein
VQMTGVGASLPVICFVNRWIETRRNKRAVRDVSMMRTPGMQARRESPLFCRAPVKTLFNSQDGVACGVMVAKSGVRAAWKERG